MIEPTGARRWSVWGLGFGLAGLTGLVAFLSPALGYDVPWYERPTLLWVGLNMLLGIAWLGLLQHCRGIDARSLLPLLLLTGLLPRLVLIGSEPIWEDDYYRYLWDGGVMVAGINPYAEPPSAAHPVRPFAEPDPDLLALGKTSKGVIERNAYPDIKTSYPPVAQAAFALSHILVPWERAGLRIVYWVADVLALLMLARCCAIDGRAPEALLIYAACPLLITEIHNALHMDILLMPVLAGALLAMLTKRPYVVAVLLAIACGIKFWPLLLVPVMMRAASGSVRKAIPPALFCGLLALAIVAYQLLNGGLEQNAGLQTYSRLWETNSFLFGFFSLAVEDFARPLLAVSIGALALYLMLHRDPVEACLLLIGIFFLTSPTGYPWYWLWALPFAVLRPRLWWLALVVLLPIYDVRFLAIGEDWEPTFNWVGTAVQFIPALALLIFLPRRELGLR